MNSVTIVGFGESARINDLVGLARRRWDEVKHYNFFDERDRKKLRGGARTGALILAGNGIVSEYLNNKKLASVSDIYRCDYQHFESERCLDDIYKELSDLPSIFGGVPTLGICYGCQVLNLYNGGGLPKRLDKKNIGIHKTLLSDSLIFRGMGGEGYFDYNHKYYNPNVATGVSVIATEAGVPTAYKFSPIQYGIQFHISRSGGDGEKVLDNFFKICDNFRKVNTGGAVGMIALGLATAVGTGVYYLVKSRKRLPL